MCALYDMYTAGVSGLMALIRHVYIYTQLCGLMEISCESTNGATLVVSVNIRRGHARSLVIMYI